MAKKKDENKGVDIHVDTPIVDANLEVGANGDFTAEVDTEKVDVSVEKKGKKWKIDIEFDKTKHYEIVANGNSATMPKGKVFRVIGNMARILIEKGVAELKKD
jgi:hypothetical protein